MCAAGGLLPLLSGTCGSASVKSIAFCCISTGEFRFPNQKAAEIAIETVQKVQQERHSRMEVVFNVFKDEDAQIYKRLLR